MSDSASPSPTTPARPDYGIDAPLVVRNLALAGAACLVVAAVARFGMAPGNLSRSLFNMTVAPSISLLLTAAAMVLSSKVLKIRRRETLLDHVPWRGDERVLDVGCGRGLMLNAAARRLTTGRAVGVDIWQQEDLSGNTPQATLANARAEGVADQVEVQDGDARSLPFPDNSFDTVVSCAAIHNIYDRAEREKAVQEIARVLKPGGHVVIADFRHTDSYVRILHEAGLDARKIGLKSLVGQKPA